ncbi:16S rRNA (guanine(527)-N(7))-methyltransferase RsmG [Oceanivirga salmonicida]|uniref:16S rRNA (guanine(527)-N(7))-methyltransferase RsmG n=1 Tax=Oceanivirga salmonicida TaxID=1769291 RepID=UPI0008339B6A|nr:16S rRNA (guanine(527)-N(7))-methyltransferase RsmG [Oceanivirga salmonicida]
MLNKKLEKYLELLIEKNKVINLTAIRDKEEIIIKHFEDSILLNDLLKETDKNIIDIGTGAGFPGMVLAILNPDKNFLLVDSVTKKVNFLNEVINELNLKNVKTSNLRAEQLIINNREKFDIGLCRGVANLRIILEYEIPFLKVNGRFLVQKLNTNEIAESENALNILNSKIEKVHKFNLPIINDERIVIEIKKYKKTDLKYPRKIGIPKKNPL